MSSTNPRPSASLQSTTDARNYFAQIISGPISDSERVDRMIRLINQSAENIQSTAQQNTAPIEWLKSFPRLVRFTDNTVITAALICYDVYHLIQQVREPWLRMRRQIAKPAKSSRLKQRLRDLALPVIDWLLLVFLCKSACEKNKPGKRREKALATLSCFRGRLFLRMGLHLQALDCFGAAAAWGFEQQKIGFLIGVTAQLAGRTREAETAFRYAIESRKPDPQTFRNLGLVLLTLGQEEEAVRLLDRAIRIEPAFSMAHQNLAGFYDSFEYRPQALDMVYSAQVMLYDAYNLAGEQLVHMGRGEEGVKCYGKAIQCQRDMANIAHLPDQLKSTLERDFNIDPQDPIRILPYEWVTLIGHIAMLDTYKKLQLLEMSAPGQPILLAPKHKVANPAYLDLWRKHFHIIEDKSLVDALFPYQRFYGDCFNGYIKPEGVARCWTELGAHGHIAWDAAGRDPLLQLSDETRDRGYTALKKFGMKKEDWFVAFHVRSGSFHRETKHSIQTHRNAELEDYRRALSLITDRGGWVIRMGDPNMEPAPKMDRVIDYPRSNVKSPWMDVFLTGASRFFFGTTSGLTNVAISMGTPCLLANCISNYFQLWNNRVLFILKPLWLKKEKRFMRISEMTENAFRWKLFNVSRLSELDIEPHTNTPEEMANATAEILTRLETGAIMHETEADRALRSQCEAAGNRNYFGNGRLCRSFYETRKIDLFGG